MIRILRPILLTVLALALLSQSVCASLCTLGCAIGSCPVQGQLEGSSSVAACCEHDDDDNHGSPTESGQPADDHSDPITPCAMDNAIAWAPHSYSIKPLIPTSSAFGLSVGETPRVVSIVPDSECKPYELAIGVGPPNQYDPSSNSNRAPPAA